MNKTQQTTIEHIVGNGALARYEQIFHFLLSIISKPFKIGIFIPLRYLTFSLDSFLLDNSLKSMWSKGVYIMILNNCPLHIV